MTGENIILFWLDLATRVGKAIVHNLEHQLDQPSVLAQYEVMLFDHVGKIEDMISKTSSLRHEISENHSSSIVITLKNPVEGVAIEDLSGRIIPDLLHDYSTYHYAASIYHCLEEIAEEAENEKVAEVAQLFSEQYEELANEMEDVRQSAVQYYVAESSFENNIKE